VLGLAHYFIYRNTIFHNKKECPMRYKGKEYTGKGITVAIIDTGINAEDPRLAGASVEGWSIELGATGHAILSSSFTDENGHGTEIAAAIHQIAPDATLIAVKIMGQHLRTSAELMAAGIETAANHHCAVINLSLGTPNMGKALLLRDCCANATEDTSVVLAAAHPKGERAYPADLPETIGVAAHPDCPLDKFYYFHPKRFPKKEWGVLSDKFLAYGYGCGDDGISARYRGPGIATAYVSGMMACLSQALPKHTPDQLVGAIKEIALTPMPEIGYS
jgi:hypothetical protein